MRVVKEQKLQYFMIEPTKRAPKSLILSKIEYCYKLRFPHKIGKIKLLKETQRVFLRELGIQKIRTKLLEQT